jgi:hypothetical protein
MWAFSISHIDTRQFLVSILTAVNNRTQDVASATTSGIPTPTLNVCFGVSMRYTEKGFEDERRD